MLNIILASARPEAMSDFVQALASEAQVYLNQVHSGAEALAAVEAGAPHLVIIDSELPGINPLGLVQKLLLINAMVNTAFISPLAEDQFHEQSEGLGVLSRLPMTPDAGDAAILLRKLRQILGL